MADPGVIQNIKKAAAATGADPVAMLATSLTEDGARYGIKGDQGTSEGPFQMHRGGALPASQPLTWGDSYAAFLNRAQQFAKGQVHHGKGAAAIQRPADPAGYALKVDANTAQARRLLGNTAPARAAVPATGTTTQSSAVIPGGSLLQSLINSSAQNAGISSITLPVATPIAPRAKPAPVKVDRTAQGTGGVDQKGASIVEVARRYLGTPYLWGGSNPKTGFDCSGLVQWAAAQSGIKIPRTSQEQFKAGKPVNPGQLQPGDSVFFAKNGDVHHTGIYVGGGKFIEAPHTGDVVKIASLAGRRDYVGARRFA